MNNDKRIRIIVGHYGSGKTEFSVNYSMKLSKNAKTALADMDIVNPYFRSREKCEIMEANNIRVISGSKGHKANSDMPMMSSEILAPLQDESCNIIMDIGGNSIGANVLARYKAFFKPGKYDMFCVINRYRPETRDLSGALLHLREIEEKVGAPVTGLINNTHMIDNTNVSDVLYGQELVDELSKSTGIPVKYVSVLENIAEQLPKGMNGEIFPVKMYMRESWMEN
jgi:hypothetical protein